jgi:hypothetical protein
MSSVHFGCGFCALWVWFLCTLGVAWQLVSHGAQAFPAATSTRSSTNKRRSKETVAAKRYALTRDFPQIAMDSLRLKIATERRRDDKRHRDHRLSPAITPFDFSYGVNRWRTLRVQVFLVPAA